MRYYALFYTAEKENGDMVAGMVKSAFPLDFVRNGNSRITTMINIVKKKHAGLNPDSIIDHFIVEITEKEYERNETP